MNGYTPCLFGRHDLSDDLEGDVAKCINDLCSYVTFSCIQIHFKTITYMVNTHVLFYDMFYLDIS